MRPSIFGGAIQAALWRDGPQFVGASSSGTFIAVELEPGTHTFMIQSEAGDFMEAQLEANKTYFALVKARMGVWKARFSLDPIEPGTPDWDKVDEWLADSKEAVLNQQGRAWGDEHQANAQELWEKVHPQWSGKPNKPVMQASWGK